MIPIALHYPYHCYDYGRSSLKLLCEMNRFMIKKFFIFGIGLRSFRHHINSSKFQEKMRDLLAKFLGWTKQGDILVVIATKK